MNFHDSGYFEIADQDENVQQHAERILEMAQYIVARMVQLQKILVDECLAEWNRRQMREQIGEPFDEKECVFNVLERR